MTLELSKITGLPLIPNLPLTASEMPHTISYAILYRKKINGFAELPKSKQPPRNLWDKPYRLEQFFEDVFESDSSGSSKSTEYIEFDLDEVE